MRLRLGENHLLHVSFLIKTRVNGPEAGPKEPRDYG